MIYGLRRKFIVVSAASVLLVLSAIFCLIAWTGTRQLNNTVDALTDVISSNGGRFPDLKHMQTPRPSRGFPFPNGNIITPETQFSTRFFILWLDQNGKVAGENVDSISSITREQAREYAAEAWKRGTERGWMSEYRFKVSATNEGYAIVFVDGSMALHMTRRQLAQASLVIAGSGIVVLLLIILASRWAVRPVAESYEKQKQFITDANHELKTPLTLIMSNLDIIESEIGKNEWLDDIRSEGERMGMLVNQLVTLTRMDEEPSDLPVSPFDMSAAVADTVSEFHSLAEARQITLSGDIEQGITYRGEEGMIRRLTAILLDNAVKYCDAGGDIKVRVYGKHHPVMIVENTYQSVGEVELHRLFDRFYRADKARTYHGSFGVGLSIAKAIAQNHHGDITAYRKGHAHIGFKVVLK